MGEPKIVILSRERQEIGTTWGLFPEAILTVHEDEKQAYLDAGIENEIWTHTENRSPAIRNHILERTGLGNRVVIMDDDIRGVGRFVMKSGKPRSEKLSADEFKKLLFAGFDLAEKHGYHLFGVAPTTNPLNFVPKRSLKTSVFINGPMMCVVVTELRFDAEMPVKCDYDFTVQHIDAGKGVFRMDNLWQDNDFDKMGGGRACYKKEGDAEISFNTLMDRWPRYFRKNPKRPFEVILKAPRG
jgi:hypothetical protein